MSQPVLIEPRTDAEMAAFRALNWAYRDFLLALPNPHHDLVATIYSEAKYRAVLEAAEEQYRPPRGQMRLALIDGKPVGCGTVHTLPSGDAEIKRVYVDPQARGTGLGRRMMEQLIEDCRALGLPRILMDTGQPLAAAQALYDRLGFARRGPYQELPPEADGLLVFFEMRLDAD